MDSGHLLSALIAFLAGAALAWLFGRSQLAALRERIAAEREAVERERAQLGDIQVRFSDAFKALSAEALKGASTQFLELAGQAFATAQESAKGDLEKRQQAISNLVKPVQDALTNFELHVRELEKSREGAYAALKQQLEGLLDSQRALHLEAGNLASATSGLMQALKNPTARGRWGELQLRRVVEMAGMQEHCDFEEQETHTAGDGRRERPDLTVKLPGGKVVVVDAKTPLDAYLAAAQAPDEATRQQLLVQHAKAVRDHIVALGKRDYSKLIDETPDFVVMFLPGESFFSAALMADPSLIETGFEHRIFIASPTTLITLLRAVAYGWRQQRIEENARAIGRLGSELYERLGTLGTHFKSLGTSLTRAIEAYNRAVGSLETRVLVTARKFRDLHAAGAGDEIGELEPVEQTARALQSPEIDDSGELSAP